MKHSLDRPTPVAPFLDWQVTGVFLALFSYNTSFQPRHLRKNSHSYLHPSPHYKHHTKALYPYFSTSYICNEAMTALHLTPSRRRRLFFPTLLALGIFFLLTRQYLLITFNILIRGPYIAAYHSDHLFISQEKDNFDVTFESYPTLSSVNIDGPELVPAIIHNIRLGPQKDVSIGLEVAHAACVATHPGYTFQMWDDTNANKFVQDFFPELYPMWSNYRFVIQRADSLRYMVLYVYGGKSPKFS
jgi:hypothetical protein